MSKNRKSNISKSVLFKPLFELFGILLTIHLKHKDIQFYDINHF